ncbi:hypothetical protein [Tibeticola sp.]|uniref:hypothetical protein n=1 Tax=Tibeticola sp. TaxID=2005368 RepID=UPI0025EC28E4|nr:hypothetical protein [Tibeticola sp.]
MAFTVPIDNPIVAAIRALYGVATDVGEYIDGLITSMKKSTNRTIEAAGRVIEAAKFGFGIGFVVPVALIAIGQFILGHPLLAVGTVITSPVNPVAMTCAAIGAIYFGWNALSEAERNDIVERIQSSLELGAELVKSIVAFVIGKSKELLNSETLADLKRFIGDAASLFGRTVADVTRAIADRAAGAYDLVTEKLKRSPDKPDELPRLPL